MIFLFLWFQMEEYLLKEIEVVFIKKKLIFSLKKYFFKKIGSLEELFEENLEEIFENPTFNLFSFEDVKIKSISCGKKHLSAVKS